MTQDAPDATKAASDAPAHNEKPTMTEAALRAYIDERFANVDEQLDAGRQRMKSIEDEVSANTKMTSESHEMLSGITELLAAGKAGLKVLGWLGEAVKWIVKFVAPFVALWAMFHGNSDSHHNPPK